MVMSVVTLPPVYGTSTQNEDIMTSNKCFESNHPIKPQKTNTYGSESLFMDRHKSEWLTSNHSMETYEENIHEKQKKKYND